MEFPEWYEEAEKMYLKNIPYYKIGEKIGVGRKTVSHWLRKGGHKSNEKYVRKNITNKKYSYNENVFEKIDTEEKAYWLGFLYADGYVSNQGNNIEVGLASKDKEHLVKLKNFFETKREIRKKNKKTKEKEYLGYRLIVTSEKIKKDLISLGCTNKKSLTLTFPSKNKVPDKLMHHFVRGYFDGDGCITKSTNKKREPVVEILGTSEFIDSLIEWSKISVKRYGFNHSEKTFRVQFFGEKAICFLNRIYKNSTICLERKYHLYNQIAPCKSNFTGEAGEIGLSEIVDEKL